MAARRMDRAVALVLIISAILAVDFPSETVAQPSCQNEIASLSPCYRYIYESDADPSPLCCSRLGNLVETQPECLCQVLDGQGEGLNQTRVLELPSACNVQTPPTSECYCKK
ncbi:UNVERIFIED_CONTAM: hypothetical protein Slati_0443400 [Sesamum latifolium]|uniref:Bifunctional inhibitor/plant lipid transfer protein/seed storage helical domain-containing protein n=1 Tax=Sesamum latifolium TaxID=2727402 RepID=A0AAW2XYY7_9LAMI